MSEQMLISKLLRHKKSSGADAVQVINNARARRHEPPINPSAIYRYIQGETHKLGAKEARGRPPALTRNDVLKLMQARRRLIKKAA